MKELMLCGHPVRVDDQDMICITDIWKASGSEQKNRPKYFLENVQTRQLARLMEKGGITPFYTILGRHGLRLNKLGQS